MGTEHEKYMQRQPSGVYRYYRRTPNEVLHAYKHRFVRVSLKTRDETAARQKAKDVHASIERLWSALAATNDNAKEWERHANAVRLAQSLGFAYVPAAELANAPMHALDDRLRAARRSGDPASEIAVLGGSGATNPRISEVWDVYYHHAKPSLIGMSPRQILKHRASRRKALEYLKEVAGDLRMSEVDRSIVLRFRDWWVEKITAQGLRAYSANRSFTDIAGMLTVIDAAVSTKYHDVWEKVRIKETNATKLNKRLPFPSKWVQEKLLAIGAIDAMPVQARLIFYAMVETGMRLGEVCNLRQEDIQLDDEVPHIVVADRTDRRQKTEYSIRRVPLVGVSLWAMRHAPSGFPQFADKGDYASTIINKNLSDLGLRPSQNHSAYSLRHTFQDRILAAGAPDRMQADLMGHEFGRPNYGDGAEMKQRQELLERIKFDWDMATPVAP